MITATVQNPITQESVRTYTHRVTLVNHKLDRSIPLEVVTLSDSFTDICREVAHLKSLYKLAGFAIDCDAEIVPLTTAAPF